MPIAAYYTDEDTETYTNLLFTELVHEQLVADLGEEEIENDPNLEFIKSLFIYRILNTNDSVMKQLGRDLRTISEDFARSSERRRVMQQAAQVNLENINYDEFYQFLNELFSNGISRERIVVLLFFCSDIVVRAYKNPVGKFKQLFKWFLDYIVHKICNWVKDNGGWVNNSK